MSKYSNSLLDNPYWETVKATVKERDNYRCQVCGSLTRLHVHHITYKINGNSIVGNELQYIKWLITLCEKHHQETHNDRHHLLNPKSFFKVNANDFKRLIKTKKQ